MLQGPLASAGEPLAAAGAGKVWGNLPSVDRPAGAKLASGGRRRDGRLTQASCLPQVNSLPTWRASWGQPPPTGEGDCYPAKREEQ